MNFSGLPKVSTITWIFVVNPPFERPKAWSSGWLRGAPAARARARTVVPPIMMLSPSGSLAKRVCIGSQVPSSPHFMKRWYTLFNLPPSAGNNRPLRTTAKYPNNGFHEPPTGFFVTGMDVFRILRKAPISSQFSSDRFALHVRLIFLDYIFMEIKKLFAIMPKRRHGLGKSTGNYSRR